MDFDVVDDFENVEMTYVSFLSRGYISKNKHIFRHLTLHSKIAIVATGMLIVVGGLLFFIFEYSNPSTIANMSVFDKIQVSFFQSITTRTAGFASIPQESLTSASSGKSQVNGFLR